MTLQELKTVRGVAFEHRGRYTGPCAAASWHGHVERTYATSPFHCCRAAQVNRARETEEKRATERRRAALVLAIRVLQDNGYTGAARAAEEQTGISLSKVDVADNIDMMSILQEYEEYVHFKFGRQVKLIRKVTGSGGVHEGGGPDGLLPDIAAASGAGRRKGSSGSRERPRVHRGDGKPRSAGGGRPTPRDGGGGGRGEGGSGRPPRDKRGGEAGHGASSASRGDERPATPPLALGGAGFHVQVRKIGHKPVASGEGEHNPDEYYEDRLLKVSDIPRTTKFSRPLT
jgi:hypothetical protein|eukprot:COSAG01_NODE_1815_length_9170_cov_35.104509_6_plen_287_part_00